MSQRKPISKKLRFEVFKRDRFTCQYCGAVAPDVILHVDHIEPVAKGGGNDILNLITSCQNCNLGKSDRRLDDHSEVAKQRAQLEELSQRREQLEEMIRWREGLKDLHDAAAEGAFEAWDEAVAPMGLNDYGRAELKKLVKKFGLPIVFQAIDKSTTQYLKWDADGPTLESVNAAFRKIGGICHYIANPDKKSSSASFYIRGILRNRLSYVNEKQCLVLLKIAEGLGMDMEQAKEHAKSVSNWTEWRTDIQEFIDSESGDA